MNNEMDESYLYIKCPFCDTPMASSDEDARGMAILPSGTTATLSITSAMNSHLYICPKCGKRLLSGEPFFEPDHDSED